MWKTYGYANVDENELRSRLHKSAGPGDKHQVEMTTDELLDTLGSTYSKPANSGAADVRRRVFESVEVEEQTGNEEADF